MSLENPHILKNSIILYGRMLLIMFINLAMVRLLLKTLGEIDYGIYNVVGGVVTMMSFLSSSMASAAQRFYAYYIARNDKIQLKEVFSTSLTAFLLILALCLFVSESVGVWFVHCKLNIPESRLLAAKLVYQCSVFTFCLSLLTVPFLSLILASERMDVFAYISILDSFLKLLIIWQISSVGSFDTLVLYAFLLCIIQVLNFTLYAIHVKSLNRQIIFKPIWNKKLFSDIFGYCSWYMLGSVSNVLSLQGINILLNLFFNPIVNSARAIAFQIHSALIAFVNGFYSAVRPQVVKRYSIGDYVLLIDLIFKSSCLSYYLTLIIGVPLIFWMPNILEIWLPSTPEYAVLFSRLVIFNTLIEVIGLPLTTAVCADSNIKWFQIINSCIIVLNLPISYIALCYWQSPEMTMVISIITTFLSHIVKLKFAYKQFNINLVMYWHFLLRISLVSVLSIAYPLFMGHFIDGSELLNLACLTISSILYTTIIVYFIGLNREEKTLLSNLLKKFVHESID